MIPNTITLRKSIFLSLLLLLCITAANAANYCVAPMKLDNVFMTSGDTAFKAPVTNYGSETVTQITYALYDTMAQKEIDVRTITLQEPLLTGDTRALDIAFTPTPGKVSSYLMLTITAVNGHSNEASSAYTYVTCNTIAHKARKKRVLVEDYTGTWCGNCPRGIAVVEYLKRIFPEDVVCISIHDNSDGGYDPLDNKCYGSALTQKNSGRPTILLNRSGEKAYYWTDGETQVKNEKEKMTAMDIDVSAKWNDDSTAIEVTATATPCIDADSTNYAIGYVLIENGIKDPSLRQENYFWEWASLTDAPKEMDIFKNGGSVISGLTFDNVAVATKGVEYGVEGSLAGPSVADEPKTHSVTFDNLSQYRIIRNLDSLKVVAYVVDTSDGHIDNVAQCDIKSGMATGISKASINADKALPTRRYNLQGQLVESDYKGIVIEGGRKRVVK